MRIALPEKPPDRHRHPASQKWYIDTPLDLPDFWLTAIENHPDIGKIVDDDHDEPALKYVTDIKVEHLVEFDFALAFYSGPKEFFSNLVIRKVFHYKERLVGAYLDLLLATGDEIGWRPGRDLNSHGERC